MYSQDVGVGGATSVEPETAAAKPPSEAGSTGSGDASSAGHGASGAAAMSTAPLPHRLRDFILAAGLPRLATTFNACVGLVWAFRDIHVSFAGE